MVTHDTREYSAENVVGESNERELQHDGRRSKAKAFRLRFDLTIKFLTQTYHLVVGLEKKINKAVLLDPFGSWFRARRNL